MSGKRDGSRRGSGWKDLMVTRPAPGAAAIEEMKDEIAKLGETVEARAAADAERPDPATREELDAMETRLLARVAQAAAGRAEPMTREELKRLNAGLADRIAVATAPNLELAAQAGDAAARIEAAQKDDAQMILEQLRFVIHLLMWKGAPIRQDLEGIRRTANGIDAGCAQGREVQEDGFGTLSARLDRIVWGIDDLRTRRGIAFAWTMLLPVAGMALEAWTGLAAGLLGWLGF